MKQTGLKFIFMSTAIFCVFGIAGCGGRSEKPIAITRSFDAALECDQIAAEMRVNQYKADDIAGEKKRADDNVAPILVGSLLAPTNLLFLNDGKSETKEIKALALRNEELLRLGKLRDCPDTRTATVENAKVAGKGLANASPAK